MADRVAIGYPDETTATAAAGDAHRLAQDLPVFGLAIGAGLGALMGKLPKEDEKELQDALHGDETAAR